MPPLTIGTASALVAGGGAHPQKETDMQNRQAAQQNPMQKVRVMRAFYYHGKPIEKGSTGELPKLFALEMRAANKVEFIDEAPAKPELNLSPSPVKASPGDQGKKEKQK